VAAVEAAMVLPLLVLLVMGALDVGRAIMVQHSLVTAARTGCRCYCVPADLTQDEVLDAIELVMQDDRLDGYTVTFEPASRDEIQHRAPVTVSVSLPFEQVSWTGSWFLAGRILTGSCTMPGDTSQVD
jgi:hypothetical protein